MAKKNCYKAWFVWSVMLMISARKKSENKAIHFTSKLKLLEE
jgi:hypothetical protein